MLFCFKQKTAYEISACLVGSEMCIRDRRKLMRVSIEDAAQAERLVTILMGDKVEPRRQYISQHANFNREDSFEAISDHAAEGRESR